MKAKIRLATKKDVKSITSLNRRFFKEQGRDFLALISGKNSEMFVLETTDGLLGFSGLQFYAWNNTARIIDIFVHPDFRNRGFGKQLVDFGVKQARHRKARTLIAEAPSKNPVLELYKKSGFRKCGYNDRYYSNSGKKIAIFLSKDLK